MVQIGSDRVQLTPTEYDLLRVLVQNAGKVLTPTVGKGLMRGNFELAVEVFPFWQSYTPTSLRQNCVYITSPFGQEASCSARARSSRPARARIPAWCRR